MVLDSEDICRLSSLGNYLNAVIQELGGVIFEAPIRRA